MNGAAKQHIVRRAELTLRLGSGEERTNLAKHGVAFETASEIFNGRTAELPDDRYDHGEERWIAIGLTKGHELTVVYTVTDDD